MLNKILQLTLLLSTSLIFANEKSDRYGVNELSNALMLRNVKQAQTLYKKSPKSLFQKDQKDAYNALHYAVLLDGKDACDLIQLIPDTDLKIAITLEDRYGRTALDLATFFNRLEIAKALYANPATKSVPQHKKDLQLLFTADVGNVEMTELLLQNGANINVKGKNNATPLILAAPFKYNGSGEILLKYNPSLNEVDSKGFSALHYACDVGRLDLAKIMIEQGAHIECEALDGSSPLLLAIYGGFDPLIALLIEKGAQIEHSNHLGMTPLMMSAKRRYSEITLFLISKGANINAQDKQGNTPAMLATDQMAIEVVEILLKSGADTALKNNQNETILDIAIREKNQDVINLLTSKK